MTMETPKLFVCLLASGALNFWAGTFTYIVCLAKRKRVGCMYDKPWTNALSMAGFFKKYSFDKTLFQDRAVATRGMRTQNVAFSLLDPGFPRLSRVLMGRFAP